MMAGQDAQAWQARAVGSAASDIDLVFDAADRPGTVTALLAACVCGPDGQAIEADEAWDWTLNQRLQALIAMRLAAQEPVIELQSACIRCSEAMEVALDLRALVGQSAAPRFDWHSDSGIELALRLPRGRDLQNWMMEGPSSQEALAASLIEAVHGVAPDEEPPALSTLLPMLDDAFEAHDPLTALRLHTACPECAHDNTLVCDLEALLIDGFSRAQARMLNDVLQLASAFHWREADILALPRWRRAHYLRQLHHDGAWA